MSFNGLFLPGFITGTEVTEPVGESLEQHGFADQVVVGPSLVDALADPETLARMMHGKKVAGHSGAQVAIAAAFRKYPDKPPLEIVAFNPPEPTPVARLVVSALRIVQSDAKLLASREAARVNLRDIFKDRTRQLLGNIAANTVLAREISEFSTKDFLRQLKQDRQITGAIVSADKDEFFENPYCCHDLTAANPVIEEINGGHNLVIYDPDSALDQLVDFPSLGRAA